MSLEDAADEALEVVGFGAGENAGVVGGGAAAFEDLDFAVRAFGDAEEHLFEVEAVNASGAAAGDEDPRGVEDASGEIVEAMVGAEGGRELGIGAGHAGWVEDDGVELFA